MFPAELSGSSYENLYHMGMVVDDLDRAMREMGEQLGLSWAPRRVFPVHVRDAAGLARPLDVAATYSRQGPPYLELIQAVGDGIWSAANAGTLHHLGLYVPDVAAEIQRLQGFGFTLELQGVAADGSVAGPVYLRNAFGLRIELATLAARDMVTAWMAE